MATPVRSSSLAAGGVPRRLREDAVDLHRAAAAAVAAHVARHLVREVLRADEVEDGGAWVRARDHDRREDLLTGFERHAGGAPAAHVYRANGASTRTSAPCASALRASAWLIAPMPPLHVSPRALHAVQLSQGVVQQVVGGARRARSGPDADHAGRADRALQLVGLEPVVEQVAHRHRHHAEQLEHVAARRGRLRGRPRAAVRAGRRALRAERRRRTQEQRAQEARRSLEQLLEAGVRRRVLARVARDRLLGAARGPRAKKHRLAVGARRWHSSGSSGTGS